LGCSLRGQAFFGKYNRQLAVEISQKTQRAWACGLKAKAARYYLSLFLFIENIFNCSHQINRNPNSWGKLIAAESCTFKGWWGIWGKDVEC